MKKQNLKSLKLELQKKTISNLYSVKGGAVKTRTGDNAGVGTCYQSCVNWSKPDTCMCPIRARAAVSTQNQADDY